VWETVAWLSGRPLILQKVRAFEVYHLDRRLRILDPPSHPAPQCDVILGTMDAEGEVGVLFENPDFVEAGCRLLKWEIERRYPAKR